MRAALHIATFALLGPLVGTLGAATIDTMFGGPNIDLSRVTLDPFLFYVLFSFGYSVGVVPATLTGIIDYRLVKRKGTSTILLIASIGWAISLMAIGLAVETHCWLMLWILQSPPLVCMEPSWIWQHYFYYLSVGYALCGAVAAVACHMLMRYLPRLVAR